MYDLGLLNMKIMMKIILFATLMTKNYRHKHKDLKTKALFFPKAAGNHSYAIRAAVPSG